MMRAPRLIAAAATVMLLVDAPALATPAQDLDRAFRDLHDGRYVQARDGARAYLAANGPRFSAAFILAVAECMVHPHLRSNALAFRQLKIDYAVPSDKEMSIFDWTAQCTSPPPAAQPQQAGVSGSALSVRPSLEPGRPTDAEPPSRHPRPAAPPPPPPVMARVPAAPVVVARPLVVVASTPVAGDRCIQGYVWREAFAGDHVCVTPDVRRDVAYDNQQAAARRNPTGPYGPNTCIVGFVWRTARPDDLVCVTPDRRQQAAADNAHAVPRRVP